MTKNTQTDFSIGKFAMAAFLCLALTMTGCASNQNSDVDNYAEVHDPLEGLNRATFAFNDALDQTVAEPVARTYKTVTPKPVRKGLTNFLRNLNSPLNFANQLLQGDVRGAATDVSRAVVNTTIGVGGLIDVADTMGLKYEQEDFGQTLAVWGAGHGPYLVLPFMGPSSLRDATGGVVDALADPLRIYLFNIDEEGWYYAYAGARALDRRTALLDVLDDLRRNSIDYYAALRSSYIQRRDALVRDQDPEGAGAAPSIPDYDDF